MYSVRDPDAAILNRHVRRHRIVRGLLNINKTLHLIGSSEYSLPFDQSHDLLVCCYRLEIIWFLQTTERAK